MSSKQQTARRGSMKKDGGLKSSKENTDTIYLIQNENQVLKLKNAEMEEKIASMKVQITHYTSNLGKDQKECDSLRTAIRHSEYTDDIRLEAEKKTIDDKIQFIRGNADIIMRKIAEARQASLFQEEKMPSIKEEKKVMEKELWEMKTQNEGTKIVLENLEKDLQQSREDNEKLVSKRKQFGPVEGEISNQIEQKLVTIKNQEDHCKKMRKKQSAIILQMLVARIQYARKKEAFIMSERYSLEKKITKKRIFLLSLIRKKYLLFVKNKALQCFRASFRPLEEQQKFQRIITQTRQRKLKNRMFRIWRSEAIKKQYTTTRYFQVQNGIEKLASSVMASNLYSTFNILKYWNSNPLHQRAVEVIDSVYSANRRRCLNLFFSSLVAAQNNYLKDQQIQDSAREQSLLLVLSVYFGAWAKHTKDQKLMNRALKFKYFRELKKLRTLRKKRQLSEMLAITHQKIKQIDDKSIHFCSLKKETVLGLLDKLSLEASDTCDRNNKLEEKINNLRSDFKQNFQRFCLLRCSKVLKKKTQQALEVWRSVNRRVNKVKLIWYMLNSKLYSDLNFGFICIQKRRFEKLKLSIADKIESCEFSYNYLVQENKHIKEVLDNKLLEQEKSKFVNILHRLVRQQKEIKHKYFFKFLNSGHKCWKFKKLFQRADQIIEKRVKVAVIFMLRHISGESKRQFLINREVDRREKNINNKLIKLCFGVFENIFSRNKKMKNILQNVTDRNMELAVYNGYNAIKQIYSAYKESLVDADLDAVMEKIKNTDSSSGQTEKNIQILRERLASKEKSIFNRKALACKKIFVRNSMNKYLHYFNRWRGKVAHERKINKFTEILERKTRNIIKSRMAVNLIQKKGQEEVNQLKTRLENFKKEIDDSSGGYQKFVQDTENKIAQMEQENVFHEEEGKQLQKKTDQMDNVKVKSFRRYWGKMICRFVLRDWRIHKNEFISQWSKVYNILACVSRKNTFLIISEQMREEILRNRIKKNLSRAYSKKYRNNVGMAFKIWRLLSLNKKIHEFTESYGEEVANFNYVSNKKESIQKKYNESVDFRIYDRKLRMIFDFLKKYTRTKLDNCARQRKLISWLKAGYQAEFFKLFDSSMRKKVALNKRADEFFSKGPQMKKQKLFYILKDIVERKRVIKRLFLNKLIPHALYNLNEQFFCRIKNYHRYVEVCNKNHKTFCVQKVIETFEKKRKNILCQNIRRWRKNQYEMNIGRNLFKRLTRKSFCNRYEGMFYAWKLEAEAKKVLAYHQEEGEVRKRKVQMLRLDKFIQDFKKDKGLLLENEEGNFVVSPRFQKKKEEQERKDKNMRYKFVSRLIMSINGYSAPIKAYNNMQMYMKLREKYRKSAQFVLNHLRKPDLLLAFKTWHKAAAQFRDDFETMERKEIIKILNRQKDKMQMEYSHKLQVDQMIDRELHRYKVYAHQREKKQKLCAFILNRAANKLKSRAFNTWRERSHELRDQEAFSLAEKGQLRIQDLEQQIKDLEELQAQYVENNRNLRIAVSEALNIAEMVKRISEERDVLSQMITEKQVTCESLIQENESLNSKLYLAQKEAMKLLIISGEKP